jgi:hypothetical protein
MSSLNVGNIDRGIRILLGMVLIGLAISGTIGPWGYLGIVPLLTGAIAYCPLYRVIGFSSTRR